MKWKVKYLKDALKDLKALDHSQRITGSKNYR